MPKRTDPIVDVDALISAWRSACEDAGATEELDATEGAIHKLEPEPAAKLLRNAIARLAARRTA